MLEYSWWQYAIQPCISGIVGWGTNVLALQMTFYPIKYVGIDVRPKNSPLGFIGWQGIIPAKAEKMAARSVDLMTTKLLNTREIFSRLQPERFSEVMEKGVLLLLDEIINEVANTYMPNVWNNLTDEVRDEIVIVADRESPKFLTAFMHDMQEHIDDVLDIKHMCVSAYVENKQLLNDMFLECGGEEFNFIRRSGFLFGFLFGCLQMVIWMVYAKSWILPICGFIVGYLTNWIALKIIFRPIDPINIGPFVLHGLFLKRQKEVSVIFSRINCCELLHTKAMWDAILTGPLSKNFFALLRAHSIIFTENLIGDLLRHIAVAAMGAEEFSKMKEDIATKVMKKLPSIIDQSYEYTTEALDMENSIRTKMQNLSSIEFEGVLHPAFEEDEIILIIIGGVLGALAGALQIFFLF